jgi:flagellar biosynthesis component FlhA
MTTSKSKQRSPSKPYHIIKVPIFPANIHVLFDEPAFRQMLKDKNVPQKIEYLENGAMAEVHATPTADGRTLISLALDLNAIEDLDSTLVHESVHLFHRIMDYIAESEPSEELSAYLTEYLFVNIRKIVQPKYLKSQDAKNKLVVNELIKLKDENVGKTDRSEVKEKGKGTRRPVV